MKYFKNILKTFKTINSPSADTLLAHLPSKMKFKASYPCDGRYVIIPSPPARGNMFPLKPFGCLCPIFIGVALYAALLSFCVGRLTLDLDQGVTVDSVGRVLVWLSDFRYTPGSNLGPCFAPLPQATESGSIHLSRKPKRHPIQLSFGHLFKKKTWII